MSFNFNGKGWGNRMFLFFLLLLLVIAAFFSSSLQQRDGMLVPRAAEVLAILADPTLTPEQKINIVRQLNITESKYTSILSSSDSAQQKVQKLQQQIMQSGMKVMQKVGKDVQKIIQMDIDNEKL
jgi:hypothetical protein